MAGREWDWTEKEAVIFRSVMAVAVYTNLAGDIVIRQENDGDQAYDDTIVVPKALIGQLIKALKAEASRKD